MGYTGIRVLLLNYRLLTKQISKLEINDMVCPANKRLINMFKEVFDKEVREIFYRLLLVIRGYMQCCANHLIYIVLDSIIMKVKKKKIKENEYSDYGKLFYKHYQK